MGRKRMMPGLRMRPLDPATEARYLLATDDRELYFHPERYPALTSSALFGNDQPLHLEIGCGTGYFLSGLAQTKPDENFVGVDVALKPLTRAVEVAAEMELSNIRFLRGDFRQMYPLLQPASLQAVYLLFPAPIIAQSQRSRQLLSPAFWEAIQSALVVGGHFNLVSDRLPYLLRARAQVEALPELRPTHTEHYLMGFEAGALSYFQRKWQEYYRGEVYRFQVVRVADGEGAGTESAFPATLQAFTLDDQPPVDRAASGVPDHRG